MNSILKIPPKPHRKVDHLLGMRNNFRAPRKSCDPMTSIRIVSFYPMSFLFTDYMALCRNYFRVAGPIVRVVSAVGLVDFSKESAKGCSRTAAHNPGDTTPLTTIIGFPDPTFVFFE